MAILWGLTLCMVHLGSCPISQPSPVYTERLLHPAWIESSKVIQVQHSLFVQQDGTLLCRDSLKAGWGAGGVHARPQRWPSQPQDVAECDRWQCAPRDQLHSP